MNAKTEYNNLKHKKMKIIDKLLIIAMGLLICFELIWEIPMPLIGLIQIICAIIYLVRCGLYEDF